MACAALLRAPTARPPPGTAKGAVCHATKDAEAGRLPPTAPGCPVLPGKSVKCTAVTGGPKEQRLARQHDRPRHWAWCQV